MSADTSNGVVGTSSRPGTEVAEEAARRRTFAVISHPDAGKSTLTEALALHAAAISSAGAVHGKGDRKGVTSDWMEMEQDRGISITSAALRITYGDRVLNLLDTPGHADFSEDTYRVLSAVDCAIMLLDSAKGLEVQTLKLFDVCRARKMPVITFVNKWDRPGREPWELLDEIEQRIGLRPTPLNWPVGIAGDFRGLIDRRSEGRYTKMTRTPGGAQRAVEGVLDADEAAEVEQDAWTQAQEGVELVGALGADYDRESFLAGYPPLCCSAPRCPTSVWGSCWTQWWTWPPRRRPRSTITSGRVRWIVPSPARSSRCRPTWTRTTGTGWPSSGSVRAGSSEGWSSPTPPRGGRSPPSTPRPCSVRTAPRSTRPTPVT